MGVRFPSGSAVALNVAYGGGAFNQFVVGLSNLITALDNQVILIFWSVRYPSGATGPIGSYDIRRGVTATATLVSTVLSVTEAAASSIYRSGVVMDTPGAAGPLSYGLFQNITNAATGFNYTEAVIAAIAL